MFNQLVFYFFNANTLFINSVINQEENPERYFRLIKENKDSKKKEYIYEGISLKIF